jgi:hypothetical protein
MKTLYLVTRSLDPKGTGQARWVTRWKPALNPLAVTFADRMPAAEPVNHDASYTVNRTDPRSSARTSSYADVTACEVARLRAEMLDESGLTV